MSRLLLVLTAVGLSIGLTCAAEQFLAGSRPSDFRAGQKPGGRAEALTPRTYEATAVRLEFHDKDHGARAVVLYVIHEENRGGYRVGLAILRPDSSSAEFEKSVALPAIRECSLWGARVKQVWRARIEPCAGIRSLLPRL